jgi:hypothetical protein
LKESHPDISHLKWFCPLIVYRVLWYAYLPTSRSKALFHELHLDLARPRGDAGPDLDFDADHMPKIVSSERLSLSDIDYDPITSTFANLRDVSAKKFPYARN